MAKEREKVDEAMKQMRLDGPRVSRKAAADPGGRFEPGCYQNISIAEQQFFFPSILTVATCSAALSSLRYLTVCIFILHSITLRQDAIYTHEDRDASALTEDGDISPLADQTDHLAKEN